MDSSSMVDVKNRLPDSKEDIRSDIIKIALPVFIELLMGSLFGMVDMIMLGNYGDNATSAAGIAAVGITNQLVFIGLSLVQSLNIGATAMVARYIGAERERDVEDVVRHIVILTQIFLVLPILFIGLRYTESVMRFIGAHNDTIEIGSNYFRIIVMGFAFQAFNFSIFASMRGSGDTQTPMRINVIVNLLNVVGNIVLIYGFFGLPELGVVGAAVSTSISHVIASIMLLKYIFTPTNLISINIKKKFKVKKDIIYNLLKIGLPASLEQIALRAGILMFIRIVSSLGTVAYATHQISVNILSLSFTPGQAFGIAASTLTGKSLGAENSKLAERYINACRRVGSLVSTFIAILFFFFGEDIATLYTNNLEVIKESGKILKLIAIIQPFQSSQLILAGGLRGAGDTVWTLISTFIGILIVRVVLAYYFVMHLDLGLTGAWLAMLIDQFIRWILISYRFKSNKWKNIEIR